MSRNPSYELVSDAETLALVLGGDAAVEAERFTFYCDVIGTKTGDTSLSATDECERTINLECAREIMGQFGVRSAAELAIRYENIRVRAHSRMLAKKSKGGAFAGDFDRGDVETLSETLPYLDFFAVEERELRFKKFDGTFGLPVRRATFLTADAVTVLPYDPAHDQVLLIEQFRAGPYARGDCYPWSVEPIAGRVDVGETYAQTALRETFEEAGLTLASLEQIGNYYPSPGAFSEYLVSFVGITDLSDTVSGVFGLDAEQEDIRTFILPFDTLMAAVDAGRIVNGPLLISAFWLARNRARLRGTGA